MVLISNQGTLSKNKQMLQIILLSTRLINYYYFNIYFSVKMKQNRNICKTRFHLLKSSMGLQLRKHLWSMLKIGNFKNVLLINIFVRLQCFKFRAQQVQLEEFLIPLVCMSAKRNIKKRICDVIVLPITFFAIAKQLLLV